ncbi:MAG TPA: hypothetical protein VL128_06705 [Candidatus Eisenbacteria bacterium]|nr:hypothetical protein [Candidatus Eisenbacteria bacterium]
MKAVVEMLAGLALAAFPAIAVTFLTGQRSDELAMVVLGRIAGVALLALGITCWLARMHGQSRAAIGLVWALLFYDLSAVLIFLSTHFGMGLVGIGLWPAIALHSGLGVWSLLLLMNLKRDSPAELRNP